MASKLQAQQVNKLILLTFLHIFEEMGVKNNFLKIKLTVVFPSFFGVSYCTILRQGISDLALFQYFPA